MQRVWLPLQHPRQSSGQSAVTAGSPSSRDPWPLQAFMAPSTCAQRLVHKHISKGFFGEIKTQRTNCRNTAIYTASFLTSFLSYKKKPPRKNTPPDHRKWLHHKGGRGLHGCLREEGESGPSRHCPTCWFANFRRSRIHRVWGQEILLSLAGQV